MRRLAVATLVGGWLLLGAGATPAAAHPLGNFTSNTYAGLVVTPDAITIAYVLDLAEIPALREIQSMGDEVGYARDRCAQLAAGLTVAAPDPVTVEVRASRLDFPPGQAGLLTLRLECDLLAVTGPLAPGTAVRFEDANLTGRLGWREITVSASGVAVTGTDLPATSVSDRLRAYPDDQLRSPLDQRSAAFTVTGDGDGAAAVSASPLAPALGLFDRLTVAFTGLVGRQDLTVGFATLAAAAALLLGAVHALAPGHGKTVMAAYVISRDGTAWDALGLALTVAVTHTTGVLVLGGVLSLTQVATPERLYPWLGVASGVLFAAVGAWLVRRALSRPHHHHHDHHHHDHHHDRPEPHDHPSSRRPMGWRALVAPGLAGGLVPTPSALVVLLGGIALGRTWFGVALVVAYGLGMAATLVGAGWLLLRTRDAVRDRLAGSARLSWVARGLPLATASVVVIGGVAVALRAVAAI